MKQITYQQIIQRADTLYKNALQQKYPDLDMENTKIDVNEATEALLEALIEAINE